VVKVRDAERRGVLPRTPPEPRARITRLQARIALAAAVLALVGWSAWWGYRSPWLTVERVTVSGTAELTPQQVRDAAGIDGASIFGLDLKSAEARVQALPKVSSATVSKRGWNRVTIDVRERTVWGSWQINGVDVPIDAEGYVLDGQTAPAGSPVIVEVNPQGVVNAGDRVDPGAVELAVKLVRDAEGAFGRQVLALVYRQESGLTAVLSSSANDGQAIWVTFGDSRDYDYKVATLYVLIEQARREELTLRTVDLRFGDRLSFR